MRRALITIAGEAMRNAHEALEIGPVLEKLDATVSEIIAGHTEQTIRGIWDVATEVLAWVDAPPMGRPTYFADLDEQLGGGLRGGELTVIAARPSVGKSSVALNLALNVTFGGQHVAMGAPGPDCVPVLFFSQETSAAQMTEQAACAKAGLDAHRHRSGWFNQSEKDLLKHTLSVVLQSPPLWFDDASTVTIVQLVSRSRTMIRKERVGLVVVDYLQLLRPSEQMRSRQLEIAEMGRKLKALARACNVPVVALAQLNRSVDDAPGHRPRLTHLRESGDIEQDADNVILLHREDYYDKTKDAGRMQLIVAKQRHGPVGTKRVRWDAHTLRVTNLSAEEIAEYEGD